MNSFVELGLCVSDHECFSKSFMAVEALCSIFTPSLCIEDALSASESSNHLTLLLTKRVIINRMELMKSDQIQSDFSIYSQSVFFSFLVHQQLLGCFQVALPFVLKSVGLDLAVVPGHDDCVDHENEHTGKPHMVDENSFDIPF
jgi:hypothetical protein